MKVFFGLLLVVNVAFAVFQWLMPYEQLFPDPRRVPAAEKLALLNESGAQAVSEAEVIAKVEAETSALAQAVAQVEQEIQSRRENIVIEEVEVSERRVCYTIGPLKDKARAIEISGRYSSRNVDTELKSSLEKEYLGVMVYIGGHKNRSEALRTANQLAEQGIRDHIIINEDERKNLLSLGVFGLKKNADRLRARVAAMKFPVETEARYRERTIYWLYAEQSSETDLLQLLESNEGDSGISQIPTQCLPS
ncbi:MAG: hypothetical protein QNJ85_06910 [Gammaproteobacteria bacterium]|nr:hypothetical protein [Gammaproteobacteria bacterium]